MREVEELVFECERVPNRDDAEFRPQVRVVWSTGPDETISFERGGRKPLPFLGGRARANSQAFAILLVVARGRKESNFRLSPRDLLKLRGFENVGADPESRSTPEQILNSTLRKLLRPSDDSGVLPILVRGGERGDGWRRRRKLIVRFVWTARDERRVKAEAIEAALYRWAGIEVADDTQQRAISSASEKPTPNNLPRRRRFVNRVAELAELHGVLASSEGTAAALFGVVGTGKSALALEYAHRNLREFPGGVWWASAEGDPRVVLAGLAGEIAAASPSLGVAIARGAVNPGETLGVAKALRAALQNHEARSLLILDGVTHDDWLPFMPGGRVTVLTTAQDRRNGAGAALEVRPLGETDAVEVAQLLSGLSDRRLDDVEARAVRRVVLDKLGGLPVAVELAALAVKDWARTWVSYAEALDREGPVLLDERHRESGYPRGARAAVDISIDRLGKGSYGQLLVFAASVFHHANIPEEWLLAAIGTRATTQADATSILKGIADAVATGLLRKDEDGAIGIHEFVQLCVPHHRAHAEYAEEFRRGALVAIAAWLKGKAPNDPLLRFREMTARHRHIAQVLAETERLSVNGAWSDVAGAFGLYLRQGGELNAAQRYLATAREKLMEIEPTRAALLERIFGESAVGVSGFTVIAESYFLEKYENETRDVAAVRSEDAKKREAHWLLARLAHAIRDAVGTETHGDWEWRDYSQLIQTTLARLADIGGRIADDARSTILLTARIIRTCAPTAALPLVDGLLALESRRGAAGNTKTRDLLTARAEIMLALYEPAAAERLLREAIAISSTDAASKQSLHELHKLLSEAIAQQGRDREAEELRERVRSKV